MYWLELAIHFIVACIVGNALYGIFRMNCSKCGKTSGKYSLCFRCERERIREEAYALGYQSGLLKGNASPLFPRERWEQLRRLCHPDKHENSRASTDAFQWLQSVEPPT